MMFCCADMKDIQNTVLMTWMMYIYAYTMSIHVHVSALVWVYVFTSMHLGILGMHVLCEHTHMYTCSHNIICTYIICMHVHNMYVSISIHPLIHGLSARWCPMS